MTRSSLSPRQREIAERVARGESTKRIACALGISIRTVEVHIREAASRVPGNSTPRHKLTLYVLGIGAAA
ncbi:MAG TPA: helix-turn-helix transcriptional regulator [Gemmatimonadaceae bacterium]|nr:helix-turn-helix transcriptional regulator [Gemmatimonadaceae bacterium]